eukprot:14236338-Alexandrium_andersonii.AAC.1
MSASLVGSEMCIRDRARAASCRGRAEQFHALWSRARRRHDTLTGHARTIPVSYTHLTLPTICSV